MIRKLITLGLAAFLAGALAACGGGDSGSSANTSSADQTNPADQPNETPLPPAGGATDLADEAPEAGEPADAQTGSGGYVTQYDPNAVYTMDDVTRQGSYLKIDLEDLTPDELNRVIHRLRSEFCTCGCPNDPIDQCLVNDPACGTAVNLAKQIIREEKIKS